MVKRRFLAGRYAMAVAQPIYVCSAPNCEVHHKAIKDGTHWLQPDHCIGCGGMAFMFFQTNGEAQRYASLRLQEKTGRVRDLKRQVRFGLFTIAPNGLQVHVADYIADFVYTIIATGEEIVEDVKPKGGIDPVAALKLKWRAAQRGKPVAIYRV